MNDNYWYLKKCDIFHDLAAEQLLLLEQHCHCREFSRGQMVYTPKHTADTVLLLGRGRVRTFHPATDGKQAILGFVEPAELFGELSIFNQGDELRNEFAEAVERSSIVEVPQNFLKKLLNESSAVANKLAKHFAAKLSRAEGRLKSLLFRTSRERLIHLLSELTKTYGQPTADGVIIAQKISHQDMASIIGATRETVTITLGELQAEGVLKINQRRMTISNTAFFNTALFPA
ncbi:MAG: Crp/Fnr family transcriptional regulator [Fuerstiella sp.]